MSLNVQSLGNQMIAAAVPVFGQRWDEVRDFVRIELRTIAKRLQQIADALAAGRFDLPTGKMLVAMQVNVAINTIAAATTLVALAVEEAINAALGAVRDVVNAAAGLPLL